MTLKYDKFKNKVIKPDDNLLKSVAEYIVFEETKGKIPLLIVGAGTSSSDVLVDVDNISKKGLPLLGELLLKLKEFLPSSEDKEIVAFLKLFDGFDASMENVDREWLSKIFSSINSSKDKKINAMWDNFCNWFFFESLELENGNKYGALSSYYSIASEEVANFCKKTDALCLSANFDNYIATAVGRNRALHDVPSMEKYFKRINKFNIPYERGKRYVIHTNGDIFWLNCDGSKAEGFCINREKPMPAFKGKEYKSKDNLKCDFCYSKLRPTLSMPGTYEKDVNTLSVLSLIWKYAASKISCIITVGLSCNWDDILLKFIASMLLERKIPLLDINNFQCAVNKGKSALVEKIVKNPSFNAVCIEADAASALERINKALEITSPVPQQKLSRDWQDEIIKTVGKYEEIKRLDAISQLGLKSYWLGRGKDNNRWKHSKDVAKKAVKLYKILCKSSNKEPQTFELVLLFIAGLLHDCGHLPFSHLIEDVFEELSWKQFAEHEAFDHGQYTNIVIKELHNQSREFKELLIKYQISADEIINLINGEYGVNYIDALINSAVDADKIAYVFTDAKKSDKPVMLKESDFIKELTKSAYISGEGQIAFEASSSLYAFQLLDERARMYEELYFRTGIRCLEAAAKYIIITYLVQRYSVLDFEEMPEISKDFGDFRIKMAIQKLYGIMKGGNEDDADFLTKSVGQQTKNAIETCMKLIMSIKNNSEEPIEIKIIRYIYKSLIGKEYEHDEDSKQLTLDSIENDYWYNDNELSKLVDKLSYKKLNDIRKKIILNYPNTILIDLHEYASYFSVPRGRRKKKRIDGTYECMETILVPSADRKIWSREKSEADTGLNDYRALHDKKQIRTIFNVFTIGDDASKNEHAINMLKKELIRAVGREW